MEYSLHRDLKTRYADGDHAVEVKLGRYRIDVVRGRELIEIQHGSLAAIRDKVRRLCDEHPVRVVKPIVVSKVLVKRGRKNGKVKERRQSPKRGQLLDIFNELIYWTRVYPHENLTLEVVLVDVEEWRYPGHGRRRWRRPNDFIVEDQKLTCVHASEEYSTAADLARLLPRGLPSPFHSGHVAAGLGVHRSLAQRMTYCLRHIGTVLEAGKQGNARLYKLSPPAREAA